VRRSKRSTWDTMEQVWQTLLEYNNLVVPPKYRFCLPAVVAFANSPAILCSVGSIVLSRVVKGVIRGVKRRLRDEAIEDEAGNLALATYHEPSTQARKRRKISDAESVETDCLEMTIDTEPNPEKGLPTPTPKTAPHLRLLTITESSTEAKEANSIGSSDNQSTESPNGTLADDRALANSKHHSVCTGSTEAGGKVTSGTQTISPGDDSDAASTEEDSDDDASEDENGLNSSKAQSFRTEASVEDDMEDIEDPKGTRSEKEIVDVDPKPLRDGKNKVIVDEEDDQQGEQKKFLTEEQGNDIEAHAGVGIGIVNDEEDDDDDDFSGFDIEGVDEEVDGKEADDSEYDVESEDDNSFKDHKIEEGLNDDMEERVEASDYDMEERVEASDYDMEERVEASDYDMEERVEASDYDMEERVEASDYDMEEQSENSDEDLEERVEASDNNMKERVEDIGNNLEQSERHLDKKDNHRNNTMEEIEGKEEEVREDVDSHQREKDNKVELERCEEALIYTKKVDYQQCLQQDKEKVNVESEALHEHNISGPAEEPCQHERIPILKQMQDMLMTTYSSNEYQSGYQCDKDDTLPRESSRNDLTRPKRGTVINLEHFQEKTELAPLSSKAAKTLLTLRGATKKSSSSGVSISSLEPGTFLRECYTLESSESHSEASNKTRKASNDAPETTNHSLALDITLTPSKQSSSSCDHHIGPVSWCDTNKSETKSKPGRGESSKDQAKSELEEILIESTPTGEDEVKILSKSTICIDTSSDDDVW